MFGLGPAEYLAVALAVVSLSIVVFLVALAIRWALSGVHDTPGEEILNKRYASGELTREEYLDIGSDITREQNA